MNIHILYRVFLCFAYLLSQCNAYAKATTIQKVLDL